MYARTWSRWRCLSQMGRSCRTRFHQSNVRTRIFSLQTKLVDLSQYVWKHWRTIEKTFWLQPSVVHTEPFSPRNWRTTTQAPVPYWKYQQRQSSSSSSSTWWQWSGSWWSSWEFKESQCPSRENIGLTEPRGVNQYFRCASSEKTWVQSTKKLNENWDAISLVFLSAVLRENFSSFRNTLHNLSHIVRLNVWNLVVLRSKGKVQNWVPQRSYLLESLRIPRIEHLRSITTSDEKWQEIQYYAVHFVFLVIQGFIDSFFMLYFTYVSYIVIAGLWFFCVQQQYEVIKWVNKHKETCYKPSHSSTNKHWKNPVTAWNAMRNGVTGKELALTSWKTEIAKCGRSRTTWTLCKRRAGEAIHRAAKIGRINNSRAQS